MIIIYAMLALVALVEGQIPFDPSLIQAQCEENGGNVTAAWVALENFAICIENDFGTLATDVSEAQNSTYGAVFQKYCAKSPQLKTCYHNLLDALTPCLPQKKQPVVTSMKKVIDEAIDYLCLNNGSTLTNFFTAGGSQCISKTGAANQICASNLMQNNVNVSSTDLSGILALYDTFVKCIGHNLETCDSVIPSQTFTHLAEIMRKGVVDLASSAASGLTMSAGFIGLVLFAAIFI